MGSISPTITIRHETRPCRYSAKNAIWHAWGNWGNICGEGSGTYALVEFEDGTVKRVNPEKVRFLDSRRMFEEFDFSRPAKEG